MPFNLEPSWDDRSCRSAHAMNRNWPGKSPTLQFLPLSKKGVKIGDEYVISWDKSGGLCKQYVFKRSLRTRAGAHHYPSSFPEFFICCLCWYQFCLCFLLIWAQFSGLVIGDGWARTGGFGGGIKGAISWGDGGVGSDSVSVVGTAWGLNPWGLLAKLPLRWEVYVLRSWKIKR